MRTGKFIPTKEEGFQKPDNDALLWRYMDFTKFVSLLSSKALWCSSAASFSDPFEGAAGFLEDKAAVRAAKEERLKRWKLSDSINQDPEYKKIHDAFRDTLPGISQAKLTDEEYAAYSAKRLIDNAEKANMSFRQATYINCWYESDFESIAMWQLYSKDNQNAIAIKSSYQRLVAAISDDKVKIGRVNYIDYANPPQRYGGKYWYKSNHFEHENEVRLIPEWRIADWENIPTGVQLPVELSLLISEVYVSPWAQPWLLSLVGELSGMYKLDVPVVESVIAKKPYY
jgi:hypothetical protein